MAGLGIGNCGCGCGDGPPCTTTLCGIVLGCFSNPLPGAAVSLTWAGGSASLTTDGSGQYCFDNPVLLPGDPDVEVSYSISFDEFTTATGTWTIKCSSGGVPTITLVPVSDHACCVSCVTPVPKSLTAVTKHGMVAMDFVASGTGGTLIYRGQISYTEPDCAAWHLCENATIFFNNRCTWNINTGTPGTCTVYYTLTCGAADAYGVNRWKLAVTRNYVLAFPDTCPTAYTAGCADTVNGCVDISSCECRPWPEDGTADCTNMLGSQDNVPAPVPPTGAGNAIATCFADPSDSDCFPLELTFDVPAGTADLCPPARTTGSGTFAPPWNTSDGTQPSLTGCSPCSGLTEFVDTVSVM